MITLSGHISAVEFERLFWQVWFRGCFETEWILVAAFPNDLVDAIEYVGMQRLYNSQFFLFDSFKIYRKGFPVLDL